MELFTLLAKLSLDTKEYEREIKNIEGKKVEVPDPSIGLDRDEFDAEINDIPHTYVDNIEDKPVIELDENGFSDQIDAIPETQVDDIEDEPKIGLDTEEFDTGIADVTEGAETFAGDATNIFESVKKALIATGIVAAITGITNLITDAINKTTEMADTIDKQSKRLGISREKYQEWDHALKQSGGSVQELSRGAIKFNGIIADTNALLSDESSGFSLVGKTLDGQLETLKEAGVLTEEQANAFKQLNISLIDSNGNLKTSEQLMEEVLMATADLRPEEQLNVINDLFGRNVTGIVNLVASGKDQVKELLGEADELGLVLSDDEIDNAVAYGDAVANLQAELDAVKAEFVSGIIPVLTDAVKMVTAIVAFFNGRAGTQSLSDMWADDEDAFAEEIVTIEGTAKAAETLADKLLAMGSTSEMTAEQYAIWKGTAEELIGLVPSLGEVIDIESGKIHANSDEIRDNIKEWENLAKQKALQTLKEEKYASLTEKNKELVDKSIEANKKAAQAEAERIKAAESFSKKSQELGYGAIDLEGDIDKQISDIMDTVAEGGEAAEADLAALGATLTKYGQAATDARKAQAEANALNEEVEKGKVEYQEWLEAAERLYGIETEDANNATAAVNELNDALNQLPTNKDINVRIYGGVPAFKQAKGNWDVPYDNYPSLLHRDEMVLTATQARQYRERGGDSIDTDALAKVIGESIRENMQSVTVRSYINGREVTEEVNRNQIKELKARRFAK